MRSRFRLVSFVRLSVVLLSLVGALVDSSRVVEGQGSTSLGGDLAGKPSNATVTRIRNRLVGTTAPVTGDVLRFDGSAWEPAVVSGGGGGGDGVGWSILATSGVTQSGVLSSSGRITVTALTLDPGAGWFDDDRTVNAFFWGTFNCTTSTQLRVDTWLGGVSCSPQVSFATNGADRRISAQGRFMFRRTVTGGAMFCLGGWGGTFQGSSAASSMALNTGAYSFLTFGLPDSSLALLFEVTLTSNLNNPGQTYSVDVTESVGQ